MAWSELLPSRRKNEPGILPAAYVRSSMSTVRGKKSVPSRTDAGRGGRGQQDGVADAGHDGPVGELGEFPRLE